MLSSAFFASVRHSLFGGKLSQDQVDSIEALADAWDKYGNGNPDAFAYVLATVYNEVGSEFQPKSENLNYTAKRIREVWPNKFRSVADATPYAKNPEGLANKVYAGILGNTNKGDGWKFRGRGFAQLTGRVHYETFGKLLGVDLVGNPDLLLDRETGARVLVTGMVKGLFTGKKLGDYFGPNGDRPAQARAIVNGDVGRNGGKIAGYWEKFARALHLASLQPAPKPDAPTQPGTPETPSATGWLAAIIEFIINFIKGLRK